MVDPVTEEAVKVPCALAPDMWFDPEEAATAMRHCQTCPVLEECLNTALEEEAGQPVKARHGIRGGLRPSQRFKMDQAHAALAAELETKEVGQ